MRPASHLVKEKRSGGEYWYAIITVGPKGGRRKVKRCLGPVKTHNRKADNARRSPPLTRSDAMVEMAKAVHKVDQEGPSPRGPALTLKRWGRRYLEMREAEVSDLTLGLDRMMVDTLIQTIGPHTKLSAITPADLDDWRSWLLKEKRLAEPTVCGYCRRAKTFFNRALKRGDLKASPALTLRSVAAPTDKKLPDLSEDDIDRLIDSWPTEGAVAKYRPLVALCAYAGLRMGEALRVVWGDLRTNEGKLVVRGRGRTVTTKSHTRDVLLDERLAACLGEPGKKSDRVCAELSQNATPHRQIIDGVRASGFEPWEKPLHALRAVRSGLWKREYEAWVVDKWLGHSAEVAARHYNREIPSHYYTKDSPLELARKALAALSEEERRALLETAPQERTQ